MTPLCSPADCGFLVLTGVPLTRCYLQLPPVLQFLPVRMAAGPSWPFCSFCAAKGHTSLSPRVLHTVSSHSQAHPLPSACRTQSRPQDN